MVQEIVELRIYVKLDQPALTGKNCLCVAFCDVVYSMYSHSPSLHVQIGYILINA